MSLPLGENLEEKPRLDDFLLYVTPKVESVRLHVDDVKGFM